jgi:hypothetical protein
MKCYKCNCEATEDNWVGGFSPDKATCERCNYGTSLVIKIKTNSYSYKDGYLTISMSDNEEIELIPNGIYKGFNWFKPFSLGILKDLVLERFKKEK